MPKTAGQTQVAWALLTEGVAQSRIEAYRLRHMLSRVLSLVEKSEHKEAIYQAAGDLVTAAPRRMGALETALDRTSYALSVLGSDHLRERLPMADRALVDDATHKAKPFTASASTVAARHLLRADLMPPLGFPGGPCHVVHRIHEEIRNSRLRDELIDDVERGMKLDNAEAAKVYDLEKERGGGRFKKMSIVPHAQYRMDQRGVTVTELRMALASFSKAWMDSRSRQGYEAKQWESDMARGQPIRWVDPRIKLAIVFQAVRDTARIITTYWEGQPDPRPGGAGSCPVPR